MAKTSKVSTTTKKRATKANKRVKSKKIAGFVLKNTTYDILKAIAQIWLPALAVLWIAVANIWHLPLADQIEQTITAVIVFADTILGITLAKASANYHKGDA